MILTLAADQLPKIFTKNWFSNISFDWNILHSSAFFMERKARMNKLQSLRCSSGQATKTWKFWWNFLAKSLFFSCYPSFSPIESPDAHKWYTFSESYGSRQTRDIKSSTSKFDLEARGILSSLWTQTGPWSDIASYVLLIEQWQI